MQSKLEVSTTTYDHRREWIGRCISDIRLVERGIASFARIAVSDEESIHVIPDNVPEVDMRLRERFASAYPELSLIGHNID